MKTRYTVTVPASTANIGPGFDALGLALSLYAKFTFEEHTENVVTGCPEAFRNDDNLVLQVFRRVYEHVGRVAPKVKLHIDSTVPVERGLGSSSTCIVAGAAAANAMMGRPLSNDELFQICTAIEGHPDNVAPALFGGLAASFMNGDKAIHMPINTDPAWRFVTIIPDFPVKTHEARQILPKSLSLIHISEPTRPY